MPSMRGMFTSEITKSTEFSRAYSSASWPSAASTTPYPADCSVAFTICRIEVESSTVMIVLVILSLQSISSSTGSGNRLRAGGGLGLAHHRRGHLVQRQDLAHRS